MTFSHQAADSHIKPCNAAYFLGQLRPSWTRGHNGTFTDWAAEAQLVILRGREGLFSLHLPGEVSSRQPWVPVQLLPLSGGGQRVSDKAPCDTELSAWVWLCLLGGTLKIVWACVCVCVCLCIRKNIYAGFCLKHIFVSQGLIFICCMSTRCQCSVEMLTPSNLGMSF